MYLVTAKTPTAQIQASCQTIDDAHRYYWDQRFQSSSVQELGLWCLDQVVGWQLLHGCLKPDPRGSWQEVQRRGELASPEPLAQPEPDRWDQEATSYPYLAEDF